jgi:hypothetical protein
MSCSRRSPRCAYCNTSLGHQSPRIFIDGRWACSDCAYRLEQGEVLDLASDNGAGQPRLTRSSSLYLQAETLFPVDPYAQRRA